MSQTSPIHNNHTASLAFPARFIQGLGRSRGQQITSLNLSNLSG